MLGKSALLGTEAASDFIQRGCLQTPPTANFPVGVLIIHSHVVANAISLRGAKLNGRESMASVVAAFRADGDQVAG
jgi:hypothetical protein